MCGCDCESDPRIQKPEVTASRLSVAGIFLILMAEVWRVAACWKTIQSLGLLASDVAESLYW